MPEIRPGCTLFCTNCCDEMGVIRFRGSAKKYLGKKPSDAFNVDFLCLKCQPVLEVIK